MEEHYAWQSSQLQRLLELDQLSALAQVSAWSKLIWKCIYKEHENKKLGKIHLDGKDTSLLDESYGSGIPTL